MSLAPNRTRVFRVRPFVLVSATVLGAAVAAAPAAAQTVRPSPGVSVDLGVLEDLGRQQTVPDLLYPGPQAPRSRLLVAPPSQQRPLLVPTPDMTPRSRMQVAPPQAVARPAPPRYTPPEPEPQQPLSAPEGAHAVPPAPVPTPQPAVADQVPPAPATPVAAAEPQPEPAPAAAAAPPPPATEPEPGTAAMPEAPEPPPAAAPQPSEERIAAVQPRTSGGGDLLTLPFEDGKATLPKPAKDSLDAVAQRLAGNEGLQAQVLAYAAAEPGNTSLARRLSLSRALAVRSYLMDKGVASTRIEVRALGDQSEGGNPDRVDVRVGGS